MHINTLTSSSVAQYVCNNSQWISLPWGREIRLRRPVSKQARLHWGRDQKQKRPTKSSFGGFLQSAKVLCPHGGVSSLWEDFQATMGGAGTAHPQSGYQALFSLRKGSNGVTNRCFPVRHCWLWIVWQGIEPLLMHKVNLTSLRG